MMEAHSIMRTRRSLAKGLLVCLLAISLSPRAAVAAPMGGTTPSTEPASMGIVLNNGTFSLDKKVHQPHQYGVCYGQLSNPHIMDRCTISW